MALFFDQTWFEAELSARRKTPGDLAAALELPLAELAAIWKDQRELSRLDIDRMAQFFDLDPLEIARRAGASPRMPDRQQVSEGVDLAARLEQIETRLRALEVELATLKSQK